MVCAVNKHIKFLVASQHTPSRNLKKLLLAAQMYDQFVIGEWKLHMCGYSAKATFNTAGFCGLAMRFYRLNQAF